jgi:hypothetical protein
VADVKITELPAGGFLSGAEQFESVQNGQSVKLTADQIAAFVESEVFGNVITVGQGGTGAQSLTGYVFGTGVAPLEGRPDIPASDITGLATGAFVNLAVGPTAPSSPAVGDLWVDTN